MTRYCTGRLTDGRTALMKRLCRWNKAEEHAIESQRQRRYIDVRNYALTQRRPCPALRYKCILATDPKLEATKLRPPLSAGTHTPASLRGIMNTLFRYPACEPRILQEQAPGYREGSTKGNRIGPCRLIAEHARKEALISSQ
jgi:hypothetical protein